MRSCLCQPAVREHPERLDPAIPEVLMRTWQPPKAALLHHQQQQQQQQQCSSSVTASDMSQLPEPEPPSPTLSVSGSSTEMHMMCAWGSEANSTIRPGLAAWAVHLSSSSSSSTAVSSESTSSSEEDSSSEYVHAFGSSSSSSVVLGSSTDSLPAQLGTPQHKSINSTSHADTAAGVAHFKSPKACEDSNLTGVEPVSLFSKCSGNYAKAQQQHRLQECTCSPSNSHGVLHNGCAAHPGASTPGMQACLFNNSSGCHEAGVITCSCAFPDSRQQQPEHSLAAVTVTAGCFCNGPNRQLSQQQQQQQQLQAHRQPGVRRSWSWPWSNGSNSLSRSSQLSSSSSTAGCHSAAVKEVGTPANSSPNGGNGADSSRLLLSEGRVASAAAMAALHPAVLAHLTGRLGIAFSGGGFRYTYFIGVMDVFVHHLGLVSAGTLLSGASCGSLIAVFTKCGMPVEEVLHLTREFSADCRLNGVKGRLGIALRQYLNAYLPDDAHQLCDGTTYMAVTKVWPNIRTRLCNSFPSKAELISAVLASCHLPTLSDGSLTVNYKGRLHIDGGLLSVLTAPPNAGHTVLVCSMPSRQIAKLPMFISRPCTSDIAISPDSYQHWPYSRSATTALALEPPTPQFIDHMVARGRADAWAWAESVGLARCGVPVFPSAKRLQQLRQQAGMSSVELAPVAHS